MRKLGFTLAEVLITLGIIGVIATLTLPSLMTNTAEREYATAFKKAVSSLTEAVQMNMAMDNINFDDLLDDSASQSKDNNSLYAILCNRMQTERLAEGPKEGCDLSLDAAQVQGTETACLNYGGLQPDGNYAMFFRDGSALIWRSADKMSAGDNTGNTLCHDAAGEDVNCFKVVYDVNGTKKPNLLSNCANNKGAQQTNATTEKCTKDTVVARDQYAMKLYGLGAYPNSNVARYMFDRK